MSELLPCPFCGGAAIEYDYSDGYGVHCVSDDCTIECYATSRDSEQAARDIWNRRAPVQASEARGDDRKDAALTRAEVPAYKVGDRVIWQSVYATVFDARIIEHTFRLKLEDGCTVHASESEIIPAPPTDSRGAL